MEHRDPSPNSEFTHEEYVEAYRSNDISVSISHPAICSLCDSMLQYTRDGGVAYKSAKLWFWLLPVLSVGSVVALGPLAIIAIIVAIGISVFKIGPDVREKAYSCIVEATLCSQYVYEHLIEQRILRIE